MDPVLLEAKDWGDRPRFFPPGQHPAIQRYIKERDFLLAMPESEDRDKCLAYCQGQIAMFEEGESEAKQSYIRRYS